jgi:hypothetical protein
VHIAYKFVENLLISLLEFLDSGVHALLGQLFPERDPVFIEGIVLQPRHFLPFSLKTGFVLSGKVAERTEKLFSVAPSSNFVEFWFQKRQSLSFIFLACFVLEGCRFVQGTPVNSMCHFVYLHFLELSFKASETFSHFMVFADLVVFIVIPGSLLELRAALWTCPAEVVMATVGDGGVGQVSLLRFVEVEQFFHHDGFLPVLLEGVLSLR